MIDLRIAEGCGPTGRLLAELLQERNIRVGREGARGVVCYGVRYTGTLPCLNSQAGGRTKLTELRTLASSGVRIPRTFLPNLTLVEGITDRSAPRFPLFGRKLQHREGKDIMPAFQQEDVPLRHAAGAAYFTEYVPRETEFRVWSYRKLHLATYQKVMRHPEQYRYMGCSYRNGFAFELVQSENVPRGAVEAAANAVNAMGLDFAAVDVLQGKDGNFYVLETNTAPGVETGARQGIRSLADKIATWERNGYLRRNGAAVRA